MARVLEGRNRANAEEAASFVDKFEELEQEFASLRGKFMADAKAIRDKQKELLDDAKSQGIAKKVVKNVVKARELEARAKDLRDDLEDDDRELFVDIRKALGDFADLPLGAAAVDREDGDAEDRTGAIVDAVRSTMTDDEWNAAGGGADADEETADEDEE